MSSAGVWTGPEQVPADLGRTVVSIGVFDGVHRGHQEVVREVAARAAADGLTSVVVTFDPHPAAVVRPGSEPPLLVSVRRRAELLLRAGADAVLVLPFTRALSLESPAEFVRLVLVDSLHALEVVVGSNFRFGHRAAGSVDTLRELGSAAGFTVDALDVGRSQDRSTPFSSTAVRAALASGDVRGAAVILGRPHAVEGVVVHGDHRGRELGYPTANLAPDPANAAIPADGVYGGWLVRADGERLPSAISVGTNPTFDGTGRRVEAYVLDRDGLDLYGERVVVEFVGRLRAMLRFDSVDELVEQMAEDVQRARTLLG